MRKPKLRLAVNNTRKTGPSTKRVSKLKIFLYSLMALIVIGFVFQGAIFERIYSIRLSNLGDSSKSDLVERTIDRLMLDYEGNLPLRLTSDTVVYRVTRTKNTVQVYHRIEIGKEQLLNVLEKNEIYQDFKYYCEDYVLAGPPETGLIMTAYFSSEGGDEEIAYTLSNDTCNWD